MYKRNCDTCGKYYEGTGKYCCSKKCGAKVNQTIFKKGHLPTSGAFKKGHEYLGGRPKKGTKPWNKGLKMNEEFCKKASDRQKGVIPSKENREKRSKSNIGKHLKNGKGYGQGQYYNSPFQGIVWLRSSYEIKLAIYLDRNNIPWLYECKSFLMKITLNGIEKQTTYTPDFLLLIDDIKFIDTKGYLHTEAKLKIEEFYKLYPNLKLKVWYKKDLQNLGIKLK